MKYCGYDVGPVLKQIREDKGLTREQVSEKAGLSVSTIKQLEQGGRSLSMNSLYSLMEIYECDANTVLNIDRKSLLDVSVDERLLRLPKASREYFVNSFLFMLDNAETLAIVGG